MNVFSLAVQGVFISAVLPVLIQLVKPIWLKGKIGMWTVWAACCVVAAVYLILTKQVPAFLWEDPAQATGAVILFGGAISALAQQWYRTLEEKLKEIPSVFSGNRK